MGTLKNKLVLVVDDEALIRELFEEEFVSRGARVITAESGQSALNKLMNNAEKFDMVISDIKMPGGDGVSLMKDINAKLGYLPKLFMCSGFVDDPVALIKDTGILEFFPKPFDLINVMERIESHF